MGNRNSSSAILCLSLMHVGSTGRAMPLQTGRMMALAMGTSCRTARGARDKKTRSALSCSTEEPLLQVWGEGKLV